MISIPLALTAAALAGTWWMWPALIAGGWWFADRSYRWTWLVTIEAGAVGAQWAYLGAYAIATWPDHLLIVGVTWALYPALIAVASWLGRRSAAGEFSQTGY